MKHTVGKENPTTQGRVRSEETCAETPHLQLPLISTNANGARSTAQGPKKPWVWTVRKVRECHTGADPKTGVAPYRPHRTKQEQKAEQFANHLYLVTLPQNYQSKSAQTLRNKMKPPPQ